MPLPAILAFLSGYRLFVKTQLVVQTRGTTGQFMGKYGR